MKLLPQRTERLFSEEYFWDQIFHRIGEGESLRVVSNNYGVPYSTLHDRIHKEESKKLRYLEALTSRAMYHASRIEEIIELVEEGRMSPLSAKIAIDARKWIASRFHPRQFSERLMGGGKMEAIDIGKLHLAELRRLMMMNGKNTELKKTDSIS